MSKHLEYNQSPKFLDFREGEINKIYLDNTKIKELTGMKKFIGIEEGLKKTILF